MSGLFYRNCQVSHENVFSASFSPKRKTFLKQTVCRLPPSTPALTEPPQRSEGGTLGTRGRCRLPLCWEWDGHSVREGSQALSTDLEGVTRRCGRGCEVRTAPTGDRSRCSVRPALPTLQLRVIRPRFKSEHVLPKHLRDQVTNSGLGP